MRNELVKKMNVQMNCSLAEKDKNGVYPADIQHTSC